jgi:hypothetical protein
MEVNNNEKMSRALRLFSDSVTVIAICVYLRSTFGHHRSFPRRANFAISTRKIEKFSHLIISMRITFLVLRSSLGHRVKASVARGMST